MSFDAFAVSALVAFVAYWAGYVVGRHDGQISAACERIAQDCAEAMERQVKP